MTVRQPLLGSLTQGAIFSCARAERYTACQVYGLVMTARCDLEQDKYNVLNYVPVVSLSDWLRVDGYEIASARAEAQTHSRLESALKSVNLPKSILASQTAESILETYISRDGIPKNVAKAKPKFEDIVSRLKRHAEWQTGYSSENVDIFDCDNIGAAMIKELVTHRLAGYYFLKTIAPDEQETGFVALLREISHLPRGLARLIAGGLEADNHELTEKGEWLAYVDFSTDDFAMPLGQLESPHVEHLLQTFSTLFGRIGLPDTPPEVINRFCQTRPVEQVNI